MASLPRLLTLSAATAGGAVLAAQAIKARRAHKARAVRGDGDGRRPRIVIAGGGYIGLYTALNLRKQLGRDDVELVVVDTNPYMTYQPFLPEAAAGSIEPRHVVTSLRHELPETTVLTGTITGINHAERTATVASGSGESYEVTYDELVVGLGSVARTLPIPGLADFAIGFKYIEEAIALRNQVLGKLAEASSTWDADQRRRMLTFVFVGGGFAGIEALGEVEDMARAATKDYDSIKPEDLRFVLVEGMHRILPEVGEELGGYTLEQLRRRGVEIHLGTFLESCVDGQIELSDGQRFESDTVVWTAGVKANPVLKDTDLPLDERGRVRANAYLQVVDEEGTVVHNAWAGGDCAAVPDLSTSETPDGMCAPTAQHSVRQGRHLGRNLVRVLTGEAPHVYVHANVGTVASLGLYKGVAQIAGQKLRGPVAWFMHRSYHVLAMPTMERRVRILTDWTTAVFFRRELVPLGALQNPRAAWERAAGKKAPERDPATAETKPGGVALGGDSEK